MEQEGTRKWVRTKRIEKGTGKRKKAKIEAKVGRWKKEMP
jgi:hypothetical protein